MQKLNPAIGNNRTGTARSPVLIEEMLRSNEEFAPTPAIDDGAIAQVRKEYMAQGVPLGTVPAPASFEQLGKTAKAAFTPGSATLFTDKLAARLAFERTGVRLYQALLSKLDAPSNAVGPAREEVDLILQQELDHFALLASSIEALGGDPTVVTPSADVEAVASQGVAAILVDPRADLAQSIEVLALAELADNEGWDMLVALARREGEDGLADRFEIAQEEEREHLVKVRGWLRELRRL